MSDKIEISWEDGRGKRQTREVKMVVDAADFRGTPIYPWLVIFANPHLTSTELELFFDAEADKGLEKIQRTPRWIRKKRWMGRLPGVTNASGPKPNKDGQDDRAVAILRDNPHLSARVACPSF
jgi:hypothetical protein